MSPIVDAPTTTTRVIEVEVGTVPMDLRLRYPLRWVLLVVLLVGGFTAALMMEVFVGRTHLGTANILVLKQDNPNAVLGVEIIDPRLQSLSALARSEPFFVEVARRSGVDRTLAELSDSITATRPRLGAMIAITVKDRDPAVAEAVARQFVVSLGVVVDRVRDGSVTVLDAQARDAIVGKSVDYRGPLFQDLFNGLPAMTSKAPSSVVMGLAGAGLGALLLLGYALLVHRRERVSAALEPSRVLGVPQFALLPRLGLRSREGIQNQIIGSISLVDASLPGGMKSLAFLGVGIRPERVNTTLGAAAALATFAEQPVVVVDLDPERSLSRRCGLSRRWPPQNQAGVSEAVAERLDATSLLVPLSRRSLPRSLRGLWNAETPIGVLGFGTPREGSGTPSEKDLVDIVELLAASYTVVLHLPQLPSPLSVTGLIARCDAAVFVALDGWTPVDDALATVQAMVASAPGRSGLFLLENR